MNAFRSKQVHWIWLIYDVLLSVVAFFIGMPLLVTSAPWEYSIPLTIFGVFSLIAFVYLFPHLVKQIFIWFYRFGHDAWLYHAVQVLLLIPILFTALGIDQGGSFYVFSFTLFCIILLWVILQLPPLMLLPLLLMAIICTLPQIAAVPFRFEPNFLFKFGMGQTKGVMVTVLWAACVFACVYFPRRLQYLRYFMPQYRPPKKPARSQGFTLIELLIIIAILGILISSLGFAITRQLHASANYEVKTKITHILSAEMDAVRVSPNPLQPSDELQPLPIPLSDFEAHLALSGGVLVQPTETDKVVQISVILKQKTPGDSVERTFRLVGFTFQREAGQ